MHAAWRASLGGPLVMRNVIFSNDKIMKDVSLVLLGLITGAIMKCIKIEHTILAGRADSTENFSKALIEHPDFFPNLLDKYGYFLFEDTDKRKWILRDPDRNFKDVYNLEDLRVEIIKIIERQEGISFSTPKEQSETIDRGAFTGLSEEEIEKRYRQLYEWSKKDNRLDKKIVRETKIMLNETKKDIEKYPFVNFVVFGVLLGMFLWAIFSSLH